MNCSSLDVMCVICDWCNINGMPSEVKIEGGCDVKQLKYFKVDNLLHYFGLEFDFPLG